MERNGLVLVILLLFTIVLSPSDAFSSRKLVEVSDPNGGSIGNQDSSLSSPPPDDKKPNVSPDEPTKPNDTPNTTPSDVESKGLNDANNKTGSEISKDKILDNGKSQDGKEKVENQKQSETSASKSCKGNPICSDRKKTMIACILDFESGSNKLTLLVENEQDTDLKVNITFGTSRDNTLPPFDIHGHGMEKVNITLSGDKSSKVTLDAGNGGCELQFDQPNVQPVDNPSNSKDPENTSNPKDVNKPADTPEMPKDVDNPTDHPTKPKDPKDPKDPEMPKDPKDPKDPEMPKEENVPVNDNKADTSPNPKEVEDPKQSIDVDTSKSKDENDPLPKPTPTIVDAPTSQTNILDQLTFFSKQVTPIYGAYFAFLVALVIGASWALCSFRKRRTDNGVPYQELEMGLPESSNAVNMETVEAWDQDWDDDDWDEDNAIRSPGGGIQSKSISSNGLTSRSTKKDGWDADWDD